MASIVMCSRAAPLGETPWPRAMAFSIEILGKPCFFAAAMMEARRGFIRGSGPCCFDADLSSSAMAERCLFTEA